MTGNVFGRKLLEARNPNHAEIDQLQGSVAFEDHVVRLDVAMDDAGAVQRRHPSGQSDGDVPPFFQSQRRTAREPRFQKLALIKRHHRVETGLPSGRQLDDAPNRGVVHPRADPGLARERRAVGLEAGELRLGKLQGDRAALDLVFGARTVAYIGRRRSAPSTRSRRSSRRPAAPAPPAAAAWRR